MENVKHEMFVIQIESHSNAIRRCEQQRMEKEMCHSIFKELTGMLIGMKQQQQQQTGEHKLVCVILEL